MRKAIILFLPLLAVPAMASAQDHDHGAQPKPSDQTGASTPAPEATPPNTPAEDGAMDHSAHGMMPPATPPAPQTDTPMDHSAMDHGAMDHGATDSDSSIPQGPPPAEAFSGPSYAADAFVGPDRMAASRAAVAREVSGLPVFWFQADRAEYRARAGGDGYLWDVQGYYGGDIDKFWFKSEGEGSFGEKAESAEAQALWSHAIAPYFDVQAGVRQDLVGPERTHAVLGIQGIVPYEFELDAAAFLSNKGDITVSIEGEIDQRITQRLILQPRGEISFSAQDIPELGIGAGVDKVEAGLRLRYEFAREFAPYVGIEQEWKLGASRDFARAAGEDPSVTNFVVGVRFWF